jgi:putative hydrolase of the HAD superfamily
MTRPHRVWLFDLDNTLHNASRASLVDINRSMTDYMVRELALTPADADRLRRQYWLRYGATLIGLVRHHGVQPAHFLYDTHRLPDLEQHMQAHRGDLQAVRALPGRKYILTNAPMAYTRRVLAALGIGQWFDGVISIEDMRMFGQLRPKPDARMLRRVAQNLNTVPARCVLVEDTIDHLESARRIGMHTVWMQRWLRVAPHGPARPPRWSVMPPYVHVKVRSLAAMRRRMP